MSTTTTPLLATSVLRPPGGPLFRSQAPALVLPRRVTPPVTRTARVAVETAEREFSSSSDVKRQLAQVLALLRASQDKERPRSILEARNEEVAQSLRETELKLADRERALEEREAMITERERDLAESEALLQHREALLSASKAAPVVQRQLSEAERTALENLKAELDRQEAALKEAREQLRERERFVEESERKLFDKVQEHQERETELEQLAEELRVREDLINGTADTESAPKKEFDEFNE